jgi:hypothetical protein
MECQGKQTGGVIETLEKQCKIGTGRIPKSGEGKDLRSLVRKGIEIRHP